MFALKIMTVSGVDQILPYLYPSVESAADSACAEMRELIRSGGVTVGYPGYAAVVEIVPCGDL